MGCCCMIPSYQPQLIGGMLEQRLKAFDALKKQRDAFTEKMNAELERLGIEIAYLTSGDVFK